MSTARAVGTALHDRPELFGLPSRRSAELDPLGSCSPTRRFAPAVGLDPGGRRSGAREVEAILRGSTAAVRGYGSQIATCRCSRVPAASNHRRNRSRMAAGCRSRGIACWPGWCRRRAKYIERVDQEPLARSPEISSAFLGASSVWVRGTGDGRPSIVAAAQPVWVGDQVLGVVVVEETTHSILSLRNQALERLMLLTTTGFVITAVLVLGFASRLSWRIRRLRDEAESAIDARGRITNLAAASRATDEVGDLSRSFSALLSRLGQHHSYLEHGEPAVARAAHADRGGAILAGEPASGVDAGIRADLHRSRRGWPRPPDPDPRAHVGGFAHGAEPGHHRSGALRPSRRGERVRPWLSHGSPRRDFIASLPRHPVWVSGAPDLAAQLLDKLVDNAGDFALPDTPIRVDLAFDGPIGAVLAVSNQGPQLPAELEGRLFESMVSGRKGGGGDQPIGLGLYVAHDRALSACATACDSARPSGGSARA